MATGTKIIKIKNFHVTSIDKMDKNYEPAKNTTGANRSPYNKPIFCRVERQS